MEYGHQVDTGKVLPTETLDLPELEEWARSYAKHGPYSQPVNIRYYIGIYQLGQGLSWEGTDSEYESYASSAIHLLGAAGMLDISIAEISAPHILEDMKQVDTWTKDKVFKNIQKNMCMGMMHVHYGHSTMGNMQRKSRYDPGRLQHHIFQTVAGLFSLIPKEKRAWAVLEATKIMTGAL